MNMQRETTRLVPPLTIDDVREEIETRLDQFLLKTVLYDRPVLVVPGTPPDARLPFASPWRTLYIDRVSLLDDGRIAVRRHKNGFTLEAAVPLSLALWARSRPTEQYHAMERLRWLARWTKSVRLPTPC